MSGIKVTRENPATPLPTALEAPGDFTGEEADWPTGPDSPLPLDGLSDVDAPTPMDGDVLTWDDYAMEWVAAPAGAGTAVEILDEGTPLTTTVASIDFVGAGVTASVVGDDVTVTIPGGSGSLLWFNVTDYGAVGDGSTDDRTAINSAIAAYNSAGGGVLYFPATPDYYYVSNALTALTAPGLVLGDGGGSTTGSASSVATNHATAFLFTLSHDNIRMSGLRIVNYGGTESAGAAIATTTGYGNNNRYDHLWIEGWYVGMSLLFGFEWSMSDCHITNPVLYGLRIANLDLVDGGDFALSDCWFGTRSRNATSAIRQESGGGGKIVNVKINQNGVADQSTYGGVKRYVTGVDIAIGAGVSTSILLLENTSIENVSGDAILAATSSTGSFGHISIHGAQVGLYGNNGGRAVKLSANTNGTVGQPGSLALVMIDACTFLTDGTARAAIELIKTDAVTIGDIQLAGFNARYTSTSDTNTTDGSGTGAPSTADYLVGTTQGALSAEIVVGTTPGGELGGTWASPTVDATHAGSTHIALSSATPLVESGSGSAGSGTAASKDDHVHPAASGSTAKRILLADGHATPFAFTDLLQADDGSYFLVED